MLKKIIIKYKKYFFTILIVTLSIISIIIQEHDRNQSININSEEITPSDNQIVVYITGAVKNPGVYYLKVGSRLNNLIDLCGGITDDADIAKINLAKKLVDSDKIDIPVKKDEIEYEYDEEEKEDKININTAKKEELMTLTGIGEATAQKIIDYRQTQEFIEIEDIMGVPGIGESKFNNIKEDICT